MATEAAAWILMFLGATFLLLAAIGVFRMPDLYSRMQAATKAATGRLVLPTPLPDAARRTGVLELAVGWEHAQRAAELPPIHRDPFDRFIVAQAVVENLVLITRDAILTEYPVATMTA